MTTGATERKPDRSGAIARVAGARLVGAGLVLLGACAGPGERPAASTEGQPGPGAGSAASPLYLMLARITSPGGRAHYFAPLRTLEGNDLVDTSTALEERGNARLYAQPGAGAFMLGSGESPTITRVEVDGEGRFTKGERLSFAELGVSSLGFRAVTFVDANRALYRDDSQLQVIEWNPTTMTITRTIELPADLARPGYTAFSGPAVARGDRFLFPLMWYTPAVDDVPAEVALVTVDLATGQATAVRDPRCPVGGVTFDGPDGATYFVSQLTSTYADRMFRRGRAGCVLRIRAGETVFDPTYLLELGDLVAGAPAAAVAWGGQGYLWFRSLDEGLHAPPAGTTYAEFYAASAWRLWRVDVTRPEAGALPADLPPASCCGQSYVVDGVPYGQEVVGEVGTLVDLSGDRPRPTISVRAFIIDLVRLR
jgi:hypothetical protein